MTSGDAAITAEPFTQDPVHTLDFSAQVTEHGKENLVLWLGFAPADGGEALAADLLYVRPKHLALEDPGLKITKCEPQGDGYAVTVEAQRCAVWAWLSHPEAELRCDANFLHLRGGEAKTFHAQISGSPEKLEIKSLFDTFVNG